VTAVEMERSVPPCPVWEEPSDPGQGASGAGADARRLAPRRGTAACALDPLQMPLALPGTEGQAAGGMSPTPAELL